MDRNLNEIKPITPAPRPLHESDPRIDTVSQPSISHWTLALIFDWVIIFFSFLFLYIVFILTDHYSVATRIFILLPLLLITILIVGSRQHAIAILGHEGGHGFITKPLWLNDLLVEIFCLWPLGSGLDGYRKFHFTHHHTMGTPLDPELEHKKLSAPEWDLPDKRYGIAKRFAKDLLGLGFNDIFLVEHYIGMLRKNMTLRDLLGPIIWWATAIAIIGYLKIWWVILIWIISLATSFWAFFRLRMWTEHMGTPNVHRISIKWWQRIFLPHNTWYHYEHHRFSTVPFWNLPTTRHFDTEEEIKSLNEIFTSYSRINKITSGTPLHVQLEDKFKFNISTSI